MKLVCAHTDPDFQHLNKTLDVSCPRCGQRMNLITKTIWQGSINQYFHAMVELVCANWECPFRKEREP
jgi:DNA-directed RNA polymerase subunit RPC12/RpoP